MVKISVEMIKAWKREIKIGYNHTHTNTHGGLHYRSALSPQFKTLKLTANRFQFSSDFSYTQQSCRSVSSVFLYRRRVWHLTSNVRIKLSDSCGE